MADGLAPT